MINHLRTNDTGNQKVPQQSRPLVTRFTVTSQVYQHPMSSDFTWRTLVSFQNILFIFKPQLISKLAFNYIQTQKSALKGLNAPLTMII